MRIIINYDPERDSADHILDLRAALAAIKKYGKPDGPHPFNLIEFEDGQIFAVRWNKNSVSVWKQ